MAKYYPGMPKEYTFQQIFKDGLIGERDATGNLVLPADTAEAVFGPAVDRTQLVLKLIGDSRFDNYDGVAGTPNSVATLAAGDLTNTNAGPQNFAKYLGGSAIRVESFAVSGSRTVTVNSLPGLDAQLNNALASGDPTKEVVAILSSTNDRSAAPLVAIDVQLAAVRAAVARVRATGRRVLLCLEPPQRGSYWAAGVPEQHAQMVSLQRELASLDPGIRLADFLTPVIDATGAVYAAGSYLDPYYDVVHEKLTAGILWGRATIIGLGDWITDNRVQTGLAVASVGNLVTNPTLTGTGGTGINGGNAPTSWSIARSTSNSWDKSYVWGAKCEPRANATAYTEEHRISLSANGTTAILRETANNATPFAQYSRVRSAANPGLEFVATTGGTSGGSVPTFNTTVGGTVTDNQITWTTVVANAPSAVARVNNVTYVLNDRITLPDHPGSVMRSFKT